MLRRVAIIAGLCACALGLLWIFTGREVDSGTVSNANVVGGVAGIVALALTIGLLWSRADARQSNANVLTADQAQAAVDYLAVETLRYWQIQAKDRRITTPSPAMVSWKWASEDVAAPAELRPELLTEGVVTRLREQLFDRLDAPARVVVLGGPGAGKTTAMLLLLIDILKHRTAGASQPVPVWLTLGGWNPGSTGLLDWAVTVLKRDYPGLAATVHGGPAAAAELIRTGRVALFLDGLDEMPPAVQGRALELIDRDSVGLRVVLTSRPAEYQAAIEDGRLYRAAVIDILPVKPEHARNFLLTDQVGRHRQAWQEVTDQLMADPGGVTARTLTSPLALSLARDTYAYSNPMDLLNTRSYPTPDALLRHLLARSLHLAYPDQSERNHAVRWLSWNAQHMGTSRDLRWWDLPTWIPNWQRQLAAGAVLFLAGGLTSGLTNGLTFGLVGGLRNGFLDGFTFGCISWLVVRLTGGHTMPPRSLFVRRPDRPEVKRLAAWLSFGLFFGLSFGLTGGLVDGLVDRLAGKSAGGSTAWIPLGLAGGLVLGLTGGLAAWIAVGATGRRWLMSELDALTEIWSKPLASVHGARPAETYHLDRRRTIVLGLAAGLAAGLTYGLAAGLMAGLMAGFAAGLAYGLAAGLAAGLMVGLFVGSGPTLELAKAELVLRLRGQRVRFMPLLETSLQRQVLRQAGAVYQFRHAALQDLLASGSPIDSGTHWSLPRPAIPTAGESHAADGYGEQAEEAGPRSAG